MKLTDWKIGRTTGSSGSRLGVPPWIAIVAGESGFGSFESVTVKNYAYDVGGRRPRESRSGLTTRTISEGAIPAMSRTVTSPSRTPGSICTVASSWRRGPWTHANSPSVRSRERASSGCMKTAGPRSSSPERVAMKSATRSGRLSDSLAMVPRAADGDVASADAHDEPAAAERLQRLARVGAIRPHFGRDAVGVGVAESVRRFPGAAFAVAQRADHAYVVAAFHREGEAVA